MGELKIGAGDSLSKLVQLRAALVGIRLTWTGKAIDDIDMLCLEYFHRRNLNDCLWNGMKELMAMPEMKELPEPIQAKLYSIVLQAQAQFELKRAQQLQKQPHANIPVPA